MSEFDKEAEREKLRKKYERDEKERESTRQMSELLLQGATMTNRHCDECGNPIFRYDGQEFCPHCQQADGQAQQDANGEPQDRAAQQQAAEKQAADQQVANQQTAEQASTPEADREPAAAEQIRDQAEDQPRHEHPGQDRASQTAPAPAAPEGRTDAVDPGEGAAALQRALTKFARQAEATDDPRQAKECLAAAREAAEALSALRR